MRIDAQRRRTKILAAGARLLARHGDAMTLDAVAKRAGVGIATVYRNFPTRESLVEHVMGDIADQAVAMLTEVVEKPPTTPEAGEALVEQLLQLIHGDGLGVLIPTMFAPDEASLSAQSRASRTKLLELLTAVVADLKACGMLHDSIKAVDFYNGIVRLIDPRNRPVNATLSSNDRDLLSIYLAGCRVGVSGAIQH